METPRQTHRLAELSAERRVRLVKLAAACDVDQSTVLRWRKGENVIPSDKLPILAGVLGVTVSELMGWPEEAAA